MDNGAAFSKQAHSVQPYNFARICLSQDYDGKLAMKRLKKAIERLKVWETQLPFPDKRVVFSPGMFSGCFYRVIPTGSWP